MHVGIATLLAFVLAYPILSIALLRWIRPKRMRLADLGREILQSPEFNEDEKALVTSMLRDAFCWRSMLSIVWHFPGIFASMVRPVADGSADVVQESRKFLDNPKAVEFVRLHQASMAAANPIAFALYWAEVVFTMILLRSVSAGFRFGLSAAVNTAPREGGGAHNSAT